MLKYIICIYRHEVLIVTRQQPTTVLDLITCTAKYTCSPVSITGEKNDLQNTDSCHSRYRPFHWFTGYGRCLFGTYLIVPVGRFDNSSMFSFPSSYRAKF